MPTTSEELMHKKNAIERYTQRMQWFLDSLSLTSKQKAELQKIRGELDSSFFHDMHMLIVRVETLER